MILRDESDRDPVYGPSEGCQPEGIRDPVAKPGEEAPPKAVEYNEYDSHATRDHEDSYSMADGGKWIIHHVLPSYLAALECGLLFSLMFPVFPFFMWSWFVVGTPLCFFGPDLTIDPTRVRTLRSVIRGRMMITIIALLAYMAQPLARLVSQASAPDTAFQSGPLPTALVVAAILATASGMMTGLDLALAVQAVPRKAVFSVLRRLASLLPTNAAWRARAWIDWSERHDGGRR